MDFTVSGSHSPDIVFLHGIQGTRLAWSSIAADLSDDYRCVLPNFAGRGERKQNFTPSALDLEHFASELHTIVQHQGSTGFVLVGWSLGVSVILEYLARYEHAPIGGIVLISGSPALNECQWFQQSEPELLQAEIVEREQRLQLSEAAHTDAVAAVWSNIKSTNHEAVLPTISLPCLVIHGENDEDCPVEHGRRLAAGIQNATFVDIPEGEHSVLRSHPSLITHAVRDFIQNL